MIARSVTGRAKAAAAHRRRLSAMAGEGLTDTRTGTNGRHSLLGQFRQSVFRRLAGYEDVNDADRLAHDPAMRWVVGGRALTGQAASTSQIGRFETEVLKLEANLAVLTDLSGHWIDSVHTRRPVKIIVLDMDSGESGERAFRPKLCPAIIGLTGRRSGPHDTRGSS